MTATTRHLTAVPEAPAPAPVVLDCIECPTGHYIASTVDTYNAHPCDTCDNTVDVRDFQFDDGETLTVVADRLAYNPVA